MGVLFVMSEGGGPAMAAELEKRIRKLEMWVVFSVRKKIASAGLTEREELDFKVAQKQV